MGGSVWGAFGIRRLADQNQRYMGAGLPAWLRTKNFADNPAFAELGFLFSPAATGAQVPTGTTDTMIDPPPIVLVQNMQSIAFAQSAGVELRGGARTIIVSHTWVAAQQAALGYPTPQMVFNAPNVVGIVTDNLLCEIVSLTHEDAFGTPMEWFLSCNTSELSAS